MDFLTNICSTQEQQMNKIVGVLLPLPFDKTFDYLINQEVKIGQIVEVPFGKEKQIGIIYEFKDKSEFADEKLKFVSKYFTYPPLSAKMLQFIQWVAQYNMAPLGMVLKEPYYIEQPIE